MIIDDPVTVKKYEFENVFHTKKNTTNIKSVLPLGQQKKSVSFLKRILQPMSAWQDPLKMPVTKLLLKHFFPMQLTPFYYYSFPLVTGIAKTTMAVCRSWVSCTHCEWIWMRCFTGNVWNPVHTPEFGAKQKGALPQTKTGWYIRIFS